MHFVLLPIDDPRVKRHFCKKCPGLSWLNRNGYLKHQRRRHSDDYFANKQCGKPNEGGVGLRDYGGTKYLKVNNKKLICRPKKSKKGRPPVEKEIELVKTHELIENQTAIDSDKQDKKLKAKEIIINQFNGDMITNMLLKSQGNNV